MKLFYSHVGRIGAANHFPLTVFNKIPLDIVERNMSPQDPRWSTILESLRRYFPAVYVNCWGVPTGGGNIFRHLNRGDVVLLVEGATSDGLVPALCEVKELLPEQQPHLSADLWNDAKYRYIFFDTEELDLTWPVLRDHLSFSSTYNPGGQFMPVAPERLTSLGGAERSSLSSCHSKPYCRISTVAAYARHCASGGLWEATLQKN